MSNINIAIVQANRFDRAIQIIKEGYTFHKDADSEVIAVCKPDSWRRATGSTFSNPATDLSSIPELREAVDHYMNTITDWNELPEDSERTDPVLHEAVENAFTQGRHAVYQQVDAYCAHVVARTLLADRKYRQEQIAKRGSNKGTDKYIALLGDYARTVHYAYAAELSEQGEAKAWKTTKQAEDVLDAYLEAFYAEETGLQE